MISCNGSYLAYGFAGPQKPYLKTLLQGAPHSGA